VVEATAVLDLTEAFLDRGPVAEPRFQPDVVTVVGGDVGDEKADRPDVVRGAAERESELVLGDGAAPSGPRVGAELLNGNLDPADDGVGAVGPAGRGVVAGRDLRTFHAAPVAPVVVGNGRQGPAGRRVALRGDREVTPLPDRGVGQGRVEVAGIGADPRPPQT